MTIVLLGPPGSGKGTVSEKLKTKDNVLHISTGELFRGEVKSGSSLGKKIQEIMQRGDLIEDALTISLLQKEIETKKKKIVILDGFPRTLAQAQALESFFPVDKVIEFEISDEAVTRRLSGRRLCPECGRSYHVQFVPPKKEGVCDSCGHVLIIRKDDTIEAIKKRLDVYHAQTAPLIEYYKAKKILYSIDASRSVDNVFNDCEKILKDQSPHP